MTDEPKPNAQEREPSLRITEEGDVRALENDDLRACDDEPAADDEGTNP